MPDARSVSRYRLARYAAFNVVYNKGGLAGLKFIEAGCRGI